MFKLVKILIRLFFSRSKHHILFLLQNNNELRPTGGFITKVLDMELGKFKISTTFRDGFTDLAQHEKIEPPKPMAEALNKGRYNGWTFRDANYDPDFNKSADKLKEFYNLVYPNNAVSGIIAVNFSFIEDLIEVIGKIKVQDSVITKENLFAYFNSITADYDQHDKQSIQDRKKVINLLFKKIIKKCSISVHKWRKINNLVKHSVLNKNFQLWFRENKWINKFNTPKFNYNEYADCLAIIDCNLLGGKSNRYIKRTIFREVQFTKERAIINVTVIWNHLGKLNRPLSTIYRGFVRIYIPKEADDISEDFKANDEFKIIESKQEIAPGEKMELKFSYTLNGNWLNNKQYKFKFIKQSGVYDETLLETFMTPIQYKFSEFSDNNAVIHENTCSIKYFPKTDINYNFTIIENKLNPRILLHELVEPNSAIIKFNEPVRFANELGKKNVKFSHKNNKKNIEIESIEWRRNNTLLYINVDSLPKIEEEFYKIELSDIVNELGTTMRKSPREVTVAYRSKFFVKH